MGAIDRSKVYIFFWGRNSSLKSPVAVRRVDLFDTSGKALGNIYFYPQGTSIPNDSFKNDQISMHLPLNDYEDIVSFIQKSTGNIYFRFDSAGDNVGFISNHLY